MCSTNDRCRSTRWKTQLPSNSWSFAWGKKGASQRPCGSILNGKPQTVIAPAARASARIELIADRSRSTSSVAMVGRPRRTRTRPRQQRGCNHDRRVKGNQCKHLAALQASPTLPCKFRGMEWNFGHNCSPTGAQRAEAGGILPPGSPRRHACGGAAQTIRLGLIWDQKPRFQ